MLLLAIHATAGNGEAEDAEYGGEPQSCPEGQQAVAGLGEGVSERVAPEALAALFLAVEMSFASPLSAAVVVPPPWVSPAPALPPCEPVSYTHLTLPTKRIV